MRTCTAGGVVERPRATGVGADPLRALGRVSGLRTCPGAVVERPGATAVGAVPLRPFRRVSGLRTCPGAVVERPRAAVFSGDVFLPCRKSAPACPCALVRGARAGGAGRRCAVGDSCFAPAGAAVYEAGKAGLRSAAVGGRGTGSAANAGGPAGGATSRPSGKRPPGAIPRPPRAIATTHTRKRSEIARPASRMRPRRRPDGSSRTKRSTAGVGADVIAGGNRGCSARGSTCLCYVVHRQNARRS